jgi:hypothetical protein
MENRCLNCGEKIPNPAPNKKYCKSACRQLYYRKVHNKSAPAWLENKIKYNFEAEQTMVIENLSNELKTYEKIRQDLLPNLNRARYRKETFELLNIYVEYVTNKNGETTEKRTSGYSASQTKDMKKKLDSTYTNFNEQLQKIDTKIIELQKEISRIRKSAEIEKAQKQKSKFLSGKDILKTEYEVLNVDGEFLELIGKPAKTFYGLIWGNRKGGKSSFAIRTAQYLTKFGKVLYWAAEEQESLTLQSKIDLFKAVDVKFHLNRDKEELIDEIGNFDFFFIDSVTLLGLEPQDIEELRQANPDTSFIVLLQSLKGGAEFKGSNTWAHNTDFNIQVQRDDKIVTYTCEGRFGNNTVTINI